MPMFATACDEFTRSSPTLVLQVTNTAVRWPGCKGATCITSGSASGAKCQRIFHDRQMDRQLDRMNCFNLGEHASAW